MIFHVCLVFTSISKQLLFIIKLRLVYTNFKYLAFFVKTVLTFGSCSVILYAPVPAEVAPEICRWGRRPPLADPWWIEPKPPPRSPKRLDWRCQGTTVRPAPRFRKGPEKREFFVAWPAWPGCLVGPDSIQAGQHAPSPWGRQTDGQKKAKNLSNALTAPEGPTSLAPTVRVLASNAGGLCLIP